MADNDLNEVIEEFVEDATVVTVPLDDTLSVSGEAADAKAVGDALALKADASAVVAIDVNGQGADNQGHILIDGTEIPVSSTDPTTLKAAIEAVDGKTAADIPMSSTPGAQTIAQAIATSVDKKADAIPMSSSDPTTVKEAIDGVNNDLGTLETTVTGIGNRTGADIPYQTGGAETIKQHVDNLAAARVVSVYGYGPDANGDVAPPSVPYADNLTSDQMEQVDDTFLIRTTGGELGISGNNAWLLRLFGSRVHTGYVAESINMTVLAMTRPTPPAITATLDEETFEAYVGSAGTYTLNYDDLTGWDANPADYGLTISNNPLDGDQIVITWDGVNNAVVTVNAVQREPAPAITATIDRDEWVAAVSTSGTTTFTYTTGWNLDPEDYGITVTNDPIAGDQIQVVYVKEVRGTITQANPTALTATGWNLYDHTNGYARVVKYSTTYGYRIDGTYTALNWVEEIGGEATSITPDQDGLFQVPGDGFVVVTDGSSSDTCIYPTWSDWINGHSGDFAAYTEDTVDLSTIMSGAFIYGLCQVGTVRDEIDFNAKQAIRRITRMAYTEENRASAAATGRAYEFDEDYIYLEAATPTVTSISLEAEYTCDDHGIEFFSGSDIAVVTEILYGQNLKDKLRRYVVTWDMSVNKLTSMGS